MTIEKLKDVSISYKGDRITVKGEGVEIILQVSSSELSKVYWGNTGKGRIKIILQE